MFHLVRRLSTTAEKVRTAYAYCIQQVQKYDYDNYVWITQLAKEHRPAMFALRAFNIETAMVADQIRSKEPILMQVRYQWWRDGLTKAYKGGAPNHPVLLALQDTLDQFPSASESNASPSTSRQQTTRSAGGGLREGVTQDMPAGPTGTTDNKPSARIKQYHLKRIIDTREGDLLDAQPPLTIEGLEQYAEGTASQLLYCQLEAVGASSREADHAASHLGKAVGITTLLKGTAYHAASRRSYLPIDVCMKHNVTQEDVYAMQPSEGLKDVALAAASVAKGHLDEARAMSKSLPKGAAQVFLPSLACHEYLQQLEKANFDLFHPSLQRRPGQGADLMHVLRVKWHLMMSTY